MRLVSQLGLPHAVKTALADNGYENVEDLGAATASDLALELGVSLPQAEQVLSEVANSTAGPSRPSGTQSARASDLLQSVAQTRSSTLSTALDCLIAHFSPVPLQSSARPNLKGKGRSLTHAPIPPGMVLELSGPPGGGKTCVGLAIALSARLAEDDPPEILVIDTEGSISPERVEQAARALLETLPIDRTVAEVIAGIHIMRVATQVQMVATLHTLDEWLTDHPKVKLVFIDTLSYHFRQPTLDLAVRKRVMDMAKQTVRQIATVHGCTVIVANQLATKLLTAENKRATFETGDRAVLMPQLGDAWTTERTIRIVLFRGPAGDDLRYAYASTASTPGASAPIPDDVPWASFDIDTAGLPCDVPPTPVSR